MLPAMVIFLSHWFTKGERGRANTFLILGNPVTVLWLSVVSGYLIELTSLARDVHHRGHPGRRSGPSSSASMVADKPRDAAWLDPAEREPSRSALAAEQATITPVRYWGAAMRSRNVVLLSVQYLLWSLGIYGFVFWLPTIVKAGSGQGIGAHRRDLGRPVRPRGHPA